MNESAPHQASPKTRISRALSAAFFAILPFLFFILVFAILQKNPLNYQHIFSDEIDYWIETATLMKRGLFNPQSGYFGYGLNTRAPLLNYGAHGFLTLLPYALLGSLTSWRQSSILLLNTLFISISLLVAYLSLKSFRKTLFTALLLFSFYPFYLYFQTGMVESLLYAGSILLAVFAQKLVREPANARPYLKSYFWLAIFLSTVRMSNLIFLIFPFLLEAFQEKRSLLKLLLKYGLAALLVLAFSFVFAAPYPWGSLASLADAESAKRRLLEILGENISSFFFPSTWHWYESLPRFLFLFYLLFTVFAGFYEKRRASLPLKLYINAQALGMGALLAVNLLLYGIGSARDLRVFSPVLFAYFLGYLLIKYEAFSKWGPKLALALLVVGLNLIVLLESAQIQRVFIAGRYQVKPRPAVLSKIKFDENSPDRWGNTVYLDLSLYTYLDWDNYDPGIGVMALAPEEAAKLPQREDLSLMQARWLITASPVNLPDYNLTEDQVGIGILLYQRISE